MKNKILFIVTQKDIDKELIAKGITKLAYPLFGFSVGYDVTFKLEEIKNDGYLFINRVLDTKSIDALEKIINNLPNNIKGIIFDDVGIIELLKNKDIEKIFYYSHFNTNYMSINYFFDYVDEIIVSTDITEKEIDEIIKMANKKVSLMAFGLISAFYSRRALISNYAEHYNIKRENPMVLEISDKKFMGYENEYGTILYHYPYFNGQRLLKKDIKYALYNPVFLDKESILSAVDGLYDGIDTDEGFLDIPTIYKVK